MSTATHHIISKDYMNKHVCYNQDNFLKVLKKREKNVPLITVSNHLSCFDDPGMWGFLHLNDFTCKNMRWALAADNICFTNRFYSYFFMLGKCVPVVRGAGVYQDAVNFCIEKLKDGDWLHIFPEGRVNMNQEFIRFKWGIGRIIYELPVTPIVIPIWHIGMEDILPNKRPYYFRVGKMMTLNFGSPIEVSSLVKQLKYDQVNPETARLIITNHIQERLLSLKAKTEKLVAGA
ncbi:tafazzin [Halyomorpha halys]|uniref:tafazzin n=1 Tax=Halyomorpha halys TaxID=286706 RepID=UPI0006D5071B|nr:tafazzin homolog [Halyomorpha halys]